MPFPNEVVRIGDMDWIFLNGGNTALVRFRHNNSVLLAMAPFDGQGCFVTITNPAFNHADSVQRFQCLAADFIRS